MNKNKIILISLLILIILAIALIFKNIGSNETDSYYHKINTERYNLMLNTSINTLKQFKKSIEDKDSISLDSYSAQLRASMINLNEIALSIDCFEAGLNRKDNKMMYGLNPLESHFVKYSQILENQNELEILVIDLGVIIDDLILIQDAQIFLENNYNEMKYRWSLVKDMLHYKPEFGL